MCCHLYQALSLIPPPGAGDAVTRRRLFQDLARLLHGRKAENAGVRVRQRRNAIRAPVRAVHFRRHSAFHPLQAVPGTYRSR